MKTSKKILGVALVFIMIFNVFAIGTFAAGTESAVDLYLSADKSNYAPGETIVLTFSAQAVPAVGNLTIGGMYCIGYNSAGIQPYSEYIDGLSDNPEKDVVAHGFEAIQGGYDASNSVIADTSWTTVDEANDWDSVIMYCVCDDGGETTFDATSKTDLFTLKMKVADNAKAGTYVIGFNKTSYEDESASINAATGTIFGYDCDYGYGTAVNYGFNNVTITVGGSTTTSATVANGDIQVQWADKANGMLNIGFRGIIGNYDHTKDLLTGSTKDLSKLAEVGVVISDTDSTPTRAEIGSTCSEVPTHKIYNFATGEYTFRAIVGNVPAYDNNTEDAIDPSTIVIYANAYIKYDGQYYEATNTVLQTTGATQYADKDMANKS